jgi:hypothetical protein
MVANSLDSGLAGALLTDVGGGVAVEFDVDVEVEGTSAEGLETG